MRRAWRPLRRMGGMVSQLSVASGGAAGVSISANSEPLFRVDTSPLSQGNVAKAMNTSGNAGFLATIEESDDDDGT